MRRSLERAEMAVYERIVQLYSPSVLIRCRRYTNQRRQAQQIGVYSLIAACLVAREVGPAVRVGWIVECVLGVVGVDVLAGARGEDWRQGCEEPLLASPRMRYLATALNALKGRAREVLVLHHIGGLTAEDLAGMLEEPVERVRARIRRPERHLAQWLGAADVRSRLAEFAAGLDRDWIQEVAACALDYLCGDAVVVGRQ